MTVKVDIPTYTQRGMASRDAFSRSAMLALYRKVLKLHKNVLPKVPACQCSAPVCA